MWTFRNPIFPGFYPDPSIYRVGEGHCLVNSTLLQISPDLHWLTKSLSERCSLAPCGTFKYRWDLPRAACLTSGCVDSARKRVGWRLVSTWEVRSG